MQILDEAEYEKWEAWDVLQAVVPRYVKAKRHDQITKELQEEYDQASDRFRFAHYNLKMLKEMVQRDEL